jgi:hypothetical protein
MVTALMRFLDSRSPVQVTAFGIALLVLVGALDYLTGYELSVSVFYLLPVMLMTWLRQRWVGFIFCGSSALIWLVLDIASGHTYGSGLIPVWNAGVRLGFFLMTSYLLSELKSHLVKGGVKVYQVAV